MARPRNSRGAVYSRKDTAFWWIRYRGCDGQIKKESSETTDREEAERFLRERLTARDEGRLPAIFSSKNLTFDEWADWFLERRSKPPFRSPNTHMQNMNALKSLRPVFGPLRLSEITTEVVEDYIAHRLAEGRKINTKFGQIRRGRIKPATVHQEFRVLTRILNVAIQQKKLQLNPCCLVEFPVSVKNSTRKPHYMTLSEQERIELVAPSYLRHVIVIMTETGLRPFKELMPMLKSQVDLENRLVHISDSKTENGIGDMPLTELAYAAFKEQMEEAVGSEYLFPRRAARGQKPYLGSLKKSWRSTLKRAGVPYFSLYELRHTFATRLSAGGVADNFVTQMLRQGHAAVFKRYSQAKLNMMREALDRLDRRANEHERSFGTARPT